MVQLDGIFGLYQQALSVREEKLNLISSNIINQDTPGYKARDIDFKEVMRNEKASYDAPLPMQMPQEGSGLQGIGGDEHYPIKYRVPMNDSLDGNTANESAEKIAFMSNVVHYSSTLAFIAAKKAALMKVIKGE